MSKAEELIACLEGEIAKRDARIDELESRYQRDVYGLNNEGDPIGGDPAGGYANDNARLRSELSAIKAQEPALPKDAILVGRSELALVRNALTLDCEQGRPIRGEMIAELDASIDRFDNLYAAPVSEAKAQGVVMPEQDGSDAQKSFWAGFEFAVCGLHNNDIRAAWNDFKSSERFKRLAAAPAAPAADAWIPVSERLPDSGSTVIAYYLNSYGKGRTIRAQHVEAWTIEAEDVADVDTECVDYSEQDDCYYLLQGWYECIDNWDEYYRVAVTEGPITHWMPLPAAPIKIEVISHDQ